MKINEDIVNIIKLAASKHPSILKMGIFGSYARGDATEDSDIDILYDYDDTMIHDMMDCLGDILDHIDKKIDFIAYYLLDEFDAEFRDSILNDVVWIYKQSST